MPVRGVPVILTLVQPVARARASAANQPRPVREPTTALHGQSPSSISSPTTADPGSVILLYRADMYSAAGRILRRFERPSEPISARAV